MKEVQQAEALRLADECDESATHWVHEIDTRFKAAKMLRAQHARIAELEAELEAVGAGGVQRLAAAPQAITDEREAFVNWLHGTYPNSYSIIQAADLWFHKHVAALAWKDRAALAATQPAAQGMDAAKLLAEKHTGMKVDYRGLLGQVRRAIKRTAGGHEEMLRQLEGHITELGQRWYAGDTDVVDELLQLYCVEREARAALAAQAKQGEQANG